LKQLDESRHDFSDAAAPFAHLVAAAGGRKATTYSIIRKKNQSGAPHLKNRELRPTQINIHLTT
jgi:hypothetical protein